MARILPSMEIVRGIAVWKARSLVMPECRELPIEVKKARKYGGAVRRRSITLFWLRVFIIVGKKLVYAIPTRDSLSM